MAASDVDGPEMNFTEGGDRVAVKVARVSADYFHVLGTQLSVGRTFSGPEDSPNGPKAAIISDALWRRYLHLGAAPTHREILLDNVPYKVVGILPHYTHLETSADIWLPLGADRRSTDHIGRVRVVARLGANVSLKEAQKEVSAGFDDFIRRYPPESRFGAPRLFKEEFRVLPLRDAVVGDVRPALFLLMGAGVFLLSICALNTATLLLSRASRRTREMAVRLAAGARPRQIVNQLLTEAVLLSFASAAVSLLLGHLGVRALLFISPADLPRTGANGSAITLDWRVFLFTLFVSIFVGVLCGLMPAAKASRTEINVLVKENAAQSGMNLRHNRGRPSLMILEVAFSLVLLAGAGVMMRSFVAKRAINYGFDGKNVITLDMSLSNPRFDQTTHVAQLVRQMEHQATAVPGVVAMATTCSLPLAAGLPMPFTIVRNDHSMIGKYDGTAAWRSVSPEYFKVFRIRLLRGRMFTAEDDEHAARVALINRAMARQYWQAIDATPIGGFMTIGEGLGPSSAETAVQIAGIVANVRDVGEEREPAMYVPVAQVPDWMNARNNRIRPIVWTIRTDGTRPSPVAKVQQQLVSLSGGQPIGRPLTMHEAIAASSARSQFYMTLLVVFASTALLLTAIGLYSLITYGVQQRMGELAIRSALGAAPGDVRQMVVMQALKLTLWGSVAGIPLAVAFNRLIISLMFGVQTWNPFVLTLVVMLLCAVSFAAAYVPSMRASRVDPATALRS